MLDLRWSVRSRKEDGKEVRGGGESCELGGRGDQWCALLFMDFGIVKIRGSGQRYYNRSGKE
jgi:hypothetical protein